MGFRRTVFITITGVVVAIAALEGLLDLVVDRWATQLAAQPVTPTNAFIVRLSQNELWLDLLDLPLFIAIAFLAAWFLTRTISRPVKRLTEATRSLAQERTPELVPVPPGEDDLSELGRSFNNMATSIHDSLERQRAFTRYVSHELRTPISALRVSLERVDLGLATLEEVAPRLKKNLAHSEALLDALLTLARSSLREGNRRGLRSILAEVLIDAEGQDVEVMDPIPAVSIMEPTLVRQSIWNLIDNALKHGRTPIRVYATESNGWLNIRVRDSGEGVPEEAQARLQEPFYRQDTKSEGIGLGITLVTTVAETLGGRVNFRNVRDGFESSLQIPVPDRA